MNSVTQVAETGPQVSQLKIILIVLIILVVGVICPGKSNESEVHQIVCQDEILENC